LLLVHFFPLTSAAIATFRACLVSLTICTRTAVSADAIHVASAISRQVDVLHSYDNKDLVKLTGQIGTPPLKIHWAAAKT